MVAHLRKIHGVSGLIEARQLADSFRRPSERKFWSCGFCVQLFDTLKDRLSHLGQHFERDAALGPWTLSNEIQGLLRQPIMGQAWSQILKARHGQHGLEASWDDSDEVTQLKTRLQMGVYDFGSATITAEVAYENCNLSRYAVHATSGIPTAGSPFAMVEQDSHQPTAWPSNGQHSSDHPIGTSFNSAKSVAKV